ncbi:hypothetical protein PUN28_010718 [Cardiocondyla obscurior]|uniref:Uncharacterized protein n=1 Tax=Cardiocondyla obscurior TaxID=286306 RepID=A0AAW2FHR8_9HYME
MTRSHLHMPSRKSGPKDFANLLSPICSTCRLENNNTRETSAKVRVTSHSNTRSNCPNYVSHYRPCARDGSLGCFPGSLLSPTCSTCRLENNDTRGLSAKVDNNSVLCLGFSSFSREIHIYTSHSHTCVIPYSCETVWVDDESAMQVIRRIMKKITTTAGANRPSRAPVARQHGGCL